jgi:hypothetical protein
MANAASHYVLSKADTEAVKEAKRIAREGNCFVYEGHDNDGPVWILYRKGKPLNVFISRSKSATGILATTKRATNCK